MSRIHYLLNEALFGLTKIPIFIEKRGLDTNTQICSHIRQMMPRTSRMPLIHDVSSLYGEIDKFQYKNEQPVIFIINAYRCPTDLLKAAQQIAQQMDIHYLCFKRNSSTNTLKMMEKISGSNSTFLTYSQYTVPVVAREMSINLQNFLASGDAQQLKQKEKLTNPY